MDKHTAYLYDVGFEIKRSAMLARNERDKLRRGTEEFSLATGRVLAFHEIISIMQQTAAGLGIPLDLLRLDDVDPDRDLT